MFKKCNSFFVVVVSVFALSGAICDDDDSGGGGNISAADMVGTWSTDCQDTPGDDAIAVFIFASGNTFTKTDYSYTTSTDGTCSGGSTTTIATGSFTLGASVTIDGEPATGVCQFNCVNLH